MQLNNTFKLITVVAMLHATTTFALLPAAAVAQPPAAPSGTSATPIDLKAPLGAAAKSIAFGSPSAEISATKPISGTLGEMVDLQREAYISELKAKIRANAPKYAPTSAPDVASPSLAVAAVTKTAEPVPESTSSAKLVSVFVSAGRTRADVMYDGIIKTVKEGDTVGAWIVASIEPGKVVVEKTITVKGNTQKGAASTTAEKYANTKKGSRAPIEFKKTISATLEWQPPDVNVNAAASYMNDAGYTNAAAVVPPLPQDVMATSNMPASPSVVTPTSISTPPGNTSFQQNFTPPGNTPLPRNFTPPGVVLSPQNSIARGVTIVGGGATTGGQSMPPALLTPGLR